MGLLDNFNIDDPRTMGLLNAGLTMLGNSGASRTPMNLGQILGGGLQAYTGTQDDFRKRKQQEEESAYMRQLREMQRQQSEMQMGELRRKNEMDAAIRGAYKDAYTPETQVANPEWNAVDQQSINLPQTLNKPANLDMRNLASKLMSVGAFDESMAIQKQLRGENYKLGKGERLYGADNKLIAEGLVDAPKSDAITPYQAAQLALEERRLSQSNRQFQQGRTDKLSAKQAPMSATLQKELMESDDITQSSRNVIDTLQAAREMNKKAYSGWGAKGRASIVSNLRGTEAADATVQLDNLMTGQALESLKATFGGMPTEGERKILLEMQASADKTPSQREEIMKRAIELAERRERSSAAKAKAIRAGTYLTEGFEMPKSSASSAGGWSMQKVD